MIAMQANTPVSDSKGKITTQWLSWFQSVTSTCNSLQTSGTTSQRPTGSRIWIGMPYFDTTLGKPVFLKTASPIVWVDATGTPV